MSAPDDYDCDEAAQIDELWEQELERRIADLDSGKVKAVAWEEVCARLRKKYQ